MLSYLLINTLTMLIKQHYNDLQNVSTTIAMYYYLYQKLPLLLQFTINICNIILVIYWYQWYLIGTTDRWLRTDLAPRSGMTNVIVDVPTGYVVSRDTIEWMYRAGFPALKRVRFYQQQLITFFEYVSQLIFLAFSPRMHKEAKWPKFVFLNT